MNSDNEAVVTEVDGRVYLYTRDKAGDPEWGLVLGPDAAEQLAAALKQKAARARAITIEACRVN